jgi:ERF superfamily
VTWQCGAALTYARRYALFTLVGIAGEDDIDAPDLNAPSTNPASAPKHQMPANNGRLNGGRPQSSPQQLPRDRNTSGRGVAPSARPAPATLDPEASTVLRDQLAAELKGISSADEATTWAYRVLAAKGTLVAADADKIEEAFQQKLTEFESASEVGKRRKAASRNLARRTEALRIDKSELSHPEPRRIRDREHVRFVTKQPCLMAVGRPPTRIIYVLRSIGRLAERSATNSPCRSAAVIIARSIAVAMRRHGGGNAGIDPAPAARALWLKTHPLPTGLEAESMDGLRAEGAGGLSLTGVDMAPAARGSNDKTKAIIPVASE